MTRWIVFDPQSAEAVAGAQLSPELHAGDALGAALSSLKESVVVMPASDAERALVVRIRRVPAAPAEPEAKYEATGFLGLMDAPVYEDDEPLKPKKWWQKIWD